MRLNLCASDSAMFGQYLKKIAGVILVGGTLAYPTIMYFSINVFSPRALALGVGLAVVMGAALQRRTPHGARLLIPMLGIVGLCLLNTVWHHARLFLYIPMLISLSLFCSFGYSLLQPPSMVELFVRGMVAIEVFSSEQTRYFQQVTLAWVIFLALNGATSAWTACCATMATWTLYNGLISYVAMGILFMAELFYRYWRFRRYVGLPTDFLFKPLFPPRD